MPVTPTTTPVASAQTPVGSGKDEVFALSASGGVITDYTHFQIPDYDIGIIPWDGGSTDFNSASTWYPLSLLTAYALHVRATVSSHGLKTFDILYAQDAAGTNPTATTTVSVLVINPLVTTGRLGRPTEFPTSRYRRVDRP